MNGAKKKSKVMIGKRERIEVDRILFYIRGEFNTIGFTEMHC